jgi:hypothetical protein
MEKSITFTVKITLPYSSENTAKFYLTSVLKDLKLKKDLINIIDFEIIESEFKSND